MLYFYCLRIIYLMALKQIIVNCLPANTRSANIRLPRRITSEEASQIFQRMLGSKGSQTKVNPKNVKVPQYMLDLFASVANENGQRRKGIPLPGSIVRSFYDEVLQQNPTSSWHFYFNVRDIEQSEVVRRAELRLYKLKGRTKGMKHHFYRIEVRDKGTNKLISNKLISSVGFGWTSFNLKDAVSKWVQKPDTNKGIKVQIQLFTPGTDGRRIKFGTNKHRNREPILVVYTDNGRNNSTQNAGDDKNELNPNNKLAKRRRQRSSTESGCNRVDMVVDIEKIKWDRWILQPRTFNAYRCKGTCGVYSSSQTQHQTNHATVQAILHEMNSEAGTAIDPPCCAPRTLGSLTLLIYEVVGGSVVVKLRNLDNMVVKTCGCM